MVDNGGWWRQERSVDGAMSNKREPGEEKDAVTILVVMLLCWGGEASRWRMVLLHGGRADDNGKRREWVSDDGAE